MVCSGCRACTDGLKCKLLSGPFGVGPSRHLKTGQDTLQVVIERMVFVKSKWSCLRNVIVTFKRRTLSGDCSQGDLSGQVNDPKRSGLFKKEEEFILIFQSSFIKRSMHHLKLLKREHQQRREGLGWNF